MTLVLFNVIFDNDIFYSVNSIIRYVLNDKIYHLLLFIIILGTLLYYYNKKNISYYFVWGIFFVIWNFFLYFNNTLVDYGYFGFILITYGAISSIDRNLMRRIIFTSYSILFVYFILNILNYFIPSIKSPISLIRSEDLLSISGEFRLINPNLFAQSNAAGSFFAMLLIFLLLKKYLFSKIEFILVVILSIVFIISSASFTSIVIALMLMIYNFLKYFTNYKVKIFLILFFICCLIFWVDYTILDETSIFIKLNVFIDYIFLIFSNPNYLFFGYNIFFPSDTQPIYTESSFLDFFANFGIAGVFFIFQFLFSIIWHNRRKSLFDYFISTFLIFIIILVQNSSLLPSNVLLMLLISKNYK